MCIIVYNPFGALVRHMDTGEFYAFHVCVHMHLKDFYRTRLFSAQALQQSKMATRVKTIKPMVDLQGTNEPDTINQAKEQIRQGN